MKIGMKIQSFELKSLKDNKTSKNILIMPFKVLKLITACSRELKFTPAAIFPLTRQHEKVK
jgi:hypothetical protein